MTKKKSAEVQTTKSSFDQTPCELFVHGDPEDKGQYRGRRFAQATDQLIIAAKDNGYRVIIKPPILFARVAMALPLSKSLDDGILDVQSIAKRLHTKLIEVEKLIPQYWDAEASGVPLDYFDNDEPLPDVQEPTPLPTYPNMPSDWSTIDVNDLVLITAGAEYGWWESVVVKRVQEILFLRLRDEPKNGLFVRHRNGVALINPGRPADQVPAVS